MLTGREPINWRGVVGPTPGGVPPSPQPLTHPATDPGPFWRRGLPLWAAVENGNGYGTWTLRLRSNALAHYPMRAGVGAGLADLSLRDETRRVFLSGCLDPRAPLPRTESTHDFSGLIAGACLCAKRGPPLDHPGAPSRRGRRIRGLRECRPTSDL